MTEAATGKQPKADNQTASTAEQSLPSDETEEVIWNNSIPGFLKEPPKQFPMQGFRFITYSKDNVKKLYANRKTLPSQFEVDGEQLEKKQQDAHPARLIQYSNMRQYVEILGDLFPATGLEIQNGKGLSIIFDTKEITDQNEIKEVLGN